jgi:hypothetical protein
VFSLIEIGFFLTISSVVKIIYDLILWVLFLYVKAPKKASRS